MLFRAEEYYKASTERMRQARALYRVGRSYALATYSAGLAVECLLRAFRWVKDKSFHGRHDLEDLLKSSDLLYIDEAYSRGQGVSDDEIRQLARELRLAMSEVIALWHNNLRFACEDSLRAFLRRIERLQGIKGDALKKNAADLLNAAQRVIDRGVRLWTSRKK